MLKKSRKPFVYTAFHKNEKGFTFISMLLTLTILAMTLPFLAYLIKSASYTTNYDEIAIRQFFQFLRDDVMNSIDYEVRSATLNLKLNNEANVTFEQYSDLIRRQVNREGHEIYLRDVRKIEFTPHQNGIRVAVTSLQGERYEKTIIFYY